MLEELQTTVLVIDDEDSIREGCRRVLTKEGYVVRTATDGGDGLLLAGREQPQVVLLDLLMPGMPGMSLLDELRATSPHSARVVVTAYATVTTALEAVRHGAHYFLPKPFTPDELIAAVEAALAARAAQALGRENHRRLGEILDQAETCLRRDPPWPDRALELLAEARQLLAADPTQP